MKTKITTLLGIESPVVQGGMAWVAESHLAAAVSNAGGLGIIGAASAPAEWVRAQIQEVKEEPTSVWRQYYADELMRKKWQSWWQKKKFRL